VSSPSVLEAGLACAARLSPPRSPWLNEGLTGRERAAVRLVVGAPGVAGSVPWGLVATESATL